DPGSHEFVVPLGDPARSPAATPAFAYPLELIGVEVAVKLPQPISSPNAAISIGGLAAAGDDGAWHPAPFELDGGWRSTGSYFGSPHEVVESGRPGSVLTVRTGASTFQEIPSADGDGRGVTIAFAPTELGRIAVKPIPVIASDRFLAATGVQGGAHLQLVI